VDRIAAGLHRLGDSLSAAGIAPLSVAGLHRVLAAGRGDIAELRERIGRFDVQVLSALTAAGFRLGKAYDLGRALADTCLGPEDRDSFDRSFGPRLVDVKNWLADLASTFPPHSSRAVVLSLRAWEKWAADPKLEGKPLAWRSQGAGVRGALRRQAEVWRALLVGEKQGPDMLNTDDYLKAANGLVGGMSAAIWRFLKPLALPLGVVILLLGAGIALLVISGTALKVVGALLAAAGAVGITGAGIRARLSTVATQLETRLWGAELDLAIANAVLIGPKGWGAEISPVDVPPTGVEPRIAVNLETLHRFREAVGARDRVMIERLLAADAEFVADEEAKSGREAIVAWLEGEPPQARRISTVPQQIVAGRPGALVAYVDPGADLWRLREGSVARWQSFADRDQAREAAGLPPE
jgi:ketosteroid isomerase-like protein